VTTIAYQHHCNSTMPLKRYTFIFLIFLLISEAYAEFIMVNETSDRRVKISLSIFPRVVAVDTQFIGKLTDAGRVRLVFVYDQERSRAEELKVRFLEKSKSVAGKPIDVLLSSVKEISQDQAAGATAYFLTERMSNINLYILIKKAVETSRILFSPFSGDVEKGVTAGIAVSSRVKPYFNLNTLRKSSIDINALLMKLSQQYE
jgi:hypothetical protein